MAKNYLENGEPFYWYEGKIFRDFVDEAGYGYYWCGAGQTDSEEITEAWDNDEWQEILIQDGLLTGIPQEELKELLHKYYDERIKYQKQYWLDKEEEIFKRINK